MAAHLTSSPEDRGGILLTVNLAALVENWQRLKRKGAGCDMGAVVKADAYGLGMDPVARALKGAGCATFYVATLDEAVSLRGIVGPHVRVICMNGPTPGHTERDFAAHNIIPVLSAPEQIRAWRSFASGNDVLMESLVQIDTGMHRLGLTEKEFAVHMDDPDGFLGLHPLALMSHLACADTPSHHLNQVQQEGFASALARFRHKFGDAKGSLANSAGVLLGPAWHFDMARPGIALYGSQPALEGAPWPLVPVVRLMARIIQVHRVDAAGRLDMGRLSRFPMAQS